MNTLSSTALKRLSAPTPAVEAPCIDSLSLSVLWVVENAIFIRFLFTFFFKFYRYDVFCAE